MRAIARKVAASVGVAAAVIGLAACGSGPDDGFASPSASMQRAFAAPGTTQLFVEPDDGRTPVLDAIASARSSIELEVYMLTDVGIESALSDAVKRGVAVSVILDRAPYVGTGTGNPNNAAFRALGAAGAHVQWSDARFTYTHEKSMVIDRSEAVIMTLNLTSSGLGSNREYGVVDRDPADVAEVENIFQADWANQPYSPSDPDLVVSPDDSRQHLTDLIASARRSITIQDEELQDGAITQLLGQKVQQGVQVQVELANLAGGVAAQEVQTLHQAGVVQARVLSTPTLHAKLVLVDGALAYVGSVNLSTVSMDQNREVGVILRDPAEVSRLARVAQQDWLKGK